MGIFSPKLTVNLKNRNFKIISFTFNPILFVKNKFLGPWPERKWEVWIEIVMGLKESCSVEFDIIPQIELEFSDLFVFSDKSPIPTSDFYRNRLNKTAQDTTFNHQIYQHFWFNDLKPLKVKPHNVDLLVAAFGPNSKRVIPRGQAIQFRDRLSGASLEEGDARFAMAFRRSSEYVIDVSNLYLPQAIERNSTGLDIRLNYPCSFMAKHIKHGQGVILIPRPFELEGEGTNLSPRKEKISKNESISFWFRYPYSETTIEHSHDVNSDQFSFLHDIEIITDEAKHTQLHSFPRVPYRYQMMHSEPIMDISPRLPNEPNVWVKWEKLYPIKPIGIRAINTDHDDSKKLFKLFFTVKDHKINADRSFYAIIATIFAGVFAELIIDPIFGSFPKWKFILISLILLGLILYIINVYFHNWRPSDVIMRFINPNKKE